MRRTDPSSASSDISQCGAVIPACAATQTRAAADSVILCPMDRDEACRCETNADLCRFLLNRCKRKHRFIASPLVFEPDKSNDVSKHPEIIQRPLLMQTSDLVFFICWHSYGQDSLRSSKYIASWVGFGVPGNF